MSMAPHRDPEYSDRAAQGQRGGAVSTGILDGEPSLRPTWAPSGQAAPPAATWVYPYHL